MSDQPDSLVLRMLRSIDERLGNIEADMIEVKTRLGTLEEQYASISRRVDRIDARMFRVEQRLGLIDPAIP